MITKEAWDSVVGIPLDDWIRADTSEQVEWLIWLRDHPLPEPPPPPCTCPPPSIPIPGCDSVFVPMIRGIDDYDPSCPAHREEW